MKILIAPDSFKESISALGFCENLGAGLKETFTDAELSFCPLADGGEGSLEAIAYSLNAEKCFVETIDPLDRPIKAYYIKTEDTAYIEMAQASGLMLLKDNEKNPLLTSTFGTGLIIKDAIDKGIKQLVLFIGGSATNDAGMGMAEALGYEFIDKNGQKLKGCGQNLEKIKSILKPKDLNLPTVIVATDVDNPFAGENGAAYVYGAQKGASSSEIERLDSGLKNIALIINQDLGIDVSDLPGSGAAGGLGGGAVAFLNAEIKKGTAVIFETLNLKKKIATSDLIISGEGRIDGQTAHGKLIDSLIETAQNKPIILLAGAIKASDYLLSKPNVIYASALANSPMNLRDSMQKADKLLIEKGKFLGRFLGKLKV